MLSHVSPSIICFEDTLNTVKYANRAKAIKTSVSRNLVSIQSLSGDAGRYAKVIDEMKAELEALVQADRSRPE